MKKFFVLFFCLFWSGWAGAQTPCNASFTYTNTAPGVYTFANTSSGGGIGASCVWDFGDGGPNSSASSPIHTYTSPGRYCVSLVVTTSTGCTDVDTQCITVTGSNPATFSCANVSASFTYTDTNQTYTFNNSTTNTNIAPATVAYSWSFGDGGTDTLPSPNHFYASAGNYTVQLNSTWTTNGAMVCQDSSTQQISVAGPPVINELFATAIWDTSISAGNASVKFWLITYDSATQMLTALDSSITPCFSNMSNISTYWNNVPTGIYLVKAHMINQSASWITNFLPTYADSAFNWQNATTVSYSGGSSSVGIYLQQGIPMTGPGFISGNVLQGANKGTAVGDPMGNITVLLRKASNNNLVASTQTDANGMYTFTNVPVGSYNVYPEELNYATTPSAPIQITAANATHAGNDFLREVVSKHLHPDNLSVMQQAATGTISISPNPAKEHLNIQFATAPAKGTMIQLYNLSGQLVKSFEISNLQTTHTQQLSLSGVAAGNYLLHIPTQTGKQVSRITVQP